MRKWDHFTYLYIDVSKWLKWALNIKGVKVRNGFVWLRKGLVVSQNLVNVLLNLHATFDCIHWTSAQFPFLGPLWNKKGLPYQLGRVPQPKVVSEFPHTNLTLLHYKKTKHTALQLKTTKRQIWTSNKHRSYIYFLVQVPAYATRVQHINISNSALFEPQHIKIMNLSNTH